MRSAHARSPIGTTPNNFQHVKKIAKKGRVEVNFESCFFRLLAGINNEGVNTVDARMQIKADQTSDAKIGYGGALGVHFIYHRIGVANAFG